MFLSISLLQFACAQSPSEAELNAPTISNSSSLAPKRTSASVGSADARNDGTPIGGGGNARGGFLPATSDSSSVFSPIVTATCRTGIMTIKVETLNNFIGVVHSRDYRKPKCSGYGENTKG